MARTPARASAEQYQRHLLSLLPPGKVWARVTPTRLARFLLAVGDELARVHDRFLDLLEEADPRTTTELLDDWEEAAGLPDTCIPDAQRPSTDAERQAALHARVIASGGATPAYLEEVADALGFGLEVEIVEPRGFRAGEAVAGDTVYGWSPSRFVAGSVAGARLWSPGWIHWWIVNDTTWPHYFRAGSRAGQPVLMWGSTYFRAGQAVAGDPLVDWRNGWLECLLNRIKPAHTKIYFTYGS